MPQVVAEKKPLVPRRYIWMTVVLLVVLVGGGFAAWLFWPQKGTAQQAVTQAEDMAKAGKAREATDKLKSRDFHTFNKADKAILNMGLASIYEDREDYAAAIEANLAAKKYGASEVDMDAAVGRLYKLKGDKLKAQEYFQKVVDSYKAKYASDPQNISNYAPYYQAQIEELKQ